MATATPTRPPATGPDVPGHRTGRRSRWAAAAVLLAAIAVAVLVGEGGGVPPAAATVGADRVSAAAVDREVAAIEAQPLYRRALAGASRLALAAPVSPSAVAAAGGDPDGLRAGASPAGVAAPRRLTTGDLRAAVLTRQVYVVALRQLVAAHHTAPTPSEAAAGREEARLDAGLDASGAPLWDRLPGWYRDELGGRAADVLALERALVGDGGITPAAVEASYARRLPTDFTTVCLRAEVVPAADAAAARRAVAGGAGRREGCAPVSSWSADVAAAVRGAGVGQVAPAVRRGDRAVVIAVTGRSTLPLSAAAAVVTTALSARYTDLVNGAVEDQLALQPVTVAAAYGTYEVFDHQVLSPDARTPSPQGHTPAPAAPVTQQLDPFD